MNECIYLQFFMWCGEKCKARTRDACFVLYYYTTLLLLLYYYTAIAISIAIQQFCYLTIHYLLESCNGDKYISFEVKTELKFKSKTQNIIFNTPNLPQQLPQTKLLLLFWRIHHGRLIRSPCCAREDIYTCLGIRRDVWITMW